MGVSSFRRLTRPRGVGAVIVAAGRSTRLGGEVPKPYLRVAGRTLLGWVLSAFDGARSVTAIVVVAARGELPRARATARASGKVIDVVPGGERRQDSVRAGLAALPPGVGVVLVHDAARPLVTADLVERCASAARRYGAAIAASPAIDTLKEVEGEVVVGTLDRARVWRAETPQGFARSLLEEGFARADREGAEVTDDAMLVERLGRPVRVVLSREPNLKVTTPADVEVVRALLRARRSA